MKKTKIDWCDSTWNPVTGCQHDCEYCYARNIAERFGGTDSEVFDEEYRLYAKHELDNPLMLNGKKAPYPYGFAPTFYRYKIEEYANKKGRNIFVCSMADLFGAWVPNEWIEEVFVGCKSASQHNYLFLTKNPRRYIELETNREMPYGDNFWFGTSVTKLSDKYAWFEAGKVGFHWFLSVEPLLEDLGTMNPDSAKPEWVIIGAETGKRKDKVVPERAWIENLVSECRKYNIPVFMKSSLEGVWGEPLIREFPKQLKTS